MRKDKRSVKQVKGTARERAKDTGETTDDQNDQNKLSSLMTNATIFALIALYYAVVARWWMAAVCSCISAGIETYALAQANRDRPSTERVYTIAYYFFSLLAVALSLFGVIAKKF
jgi:hypothetical protein